MNDSTRITSLIGILIKPAVAVNVALVLIANRTLFDVRLAWWSAYAISLNVVFAAPDTRRRLTLLAPSPRRRQAGYIPGHRDTGQVC